MSAAPRRHAQMARTRRLRGRRIRMLDFEPQPEGEEPRGEPAEAAEPVTVGADYDEDEGPEPSAR